MKKIPQEKIDYAVSELLKGRKQKDVAKEIGVDYNTLCRKLNNGYRDLIPKRTSGAKRQSAQILIPKNEVDLAYLAGIIDGEGTICKPKSSGGVRWQFYVGNTDLNLMNWLEPIGGLMGKREKPKPNYKQMYVWRIYRQSDICKLLKSVVPYMIIKKDAALQAIEEIEQYDS
jgi:hypothetical protein